MTELSYPHYYMDPYEVIKEIDETTKKSNPPDRIESHDECI